MYVQCIREGDLHTHTCMRTCMFVYIMYMHSRMYLCIHVHMHVCIMYVCACACVSMRAYGYVSYVLCSVCTYTRMRAAYIYDVLYLCIHACILMHVCKYVHMHTNMCV